MLEGALASLADPFSSLSHLLAVPVLLVLGYRLLRRGAGDTARVAALTVFVLSAVLVLAMSGVFHLLPAGSRGRYVVQHLDHAAIFLLIAGTFTPIHGIVFRGVWRWGMLLFIWTFAVTAVSLKMVFFDDVPEWLGLSMYLGMGWVGLLSGVLLWQQCGTAFVAPLLRGGLAYTLGALADFLRFPEIIPGVLGGHELFHLAILAGIGWHWQFIAGLADGSIYCPAQQGRFRLFADRSQPSRIQEGPTPVRTP